MWGWVVAREKRHLCHLFTSIYSQDDKSKSLLGQEKRQGQELCQQNSSLHDEHLGGLVSNYFLQLLSASRPEERREGTRREDKGSGGRGKKSQPPQRRTAVCGRTKKRAHEGRHRSRSLQSHVSPPTPPTPWRPPSPHPMAASTPPTPWRFGPGRGPSPSPAPLPSPGPFLNVVTKRHSVQQRKEKSFLRYKEEALGLRAPRQTSAVVGGRERAEIRIPQPCTPIPSICLPPGTSRGRERRVAWGQDATTKVTW